MNEPDLLAQLKKFIQEENRKQSDALALKIDTEVSKITDILTCDREKINKLEQDIADIKEDIGTTNKTQRQNNIIIFQTKFKEGNLLDFALNLLNSKLGLNITERDIDNIRLIGRENDKQGILIQFISFLKKLDVLKKCNKLRGSDIVITEHLSQEERDQRKKLFQYMKDARRKNLKAHLFRQKLFIEGEAYTYKDTINGNLESILAQTHHTPTIEGKGIRTGNKKKAEDNPEELEKQARKALRSHKKK